MLEPSSRLMNFEPPTRAKKGRGNKMTYRITYFMYPDPDVTIEIEAKNEDEAIIFAKGYREDAFMVEEVTK